MKLSDFDFELSEELIATRPAVPRSASRLLVATPDTMEDRVVSELGQVLRPGDRLILNNTKVIPARLSGQRVRLSDQGETRASVEITLLSPDRDGHWRALAKPGKRLKVNELIEFDGGLEAVVRDKPAAQVVLEFNLGGSEFDAALARVGMMPLPPYIASIRAVDARDNTDYQTVFAEKKGAVAAPTASLHFDDSLLAGLAGAGIAFSRVTLHVGAGTFLPVKTDDLSHHKMHSEWGEVTQQAADEINETRRLGGRIIPVGTTALRLIETAATPTGEMGAFRGNTDIFIAPGYKFRATDALMTNFHLPKSTLFVLVSALMGRARMGEIYGHAKADGYRFFSYGDSSLLVPSHSNLG